MRAIASLSLSFGLVSIPVKLYSATEASAAIRFKLVGRSGARLRQQYVAEDAPAEPEEETAAAPPPRAASTEPAPRRAAPVEADVAEEDDEDEASAQVSPAPVAVAVDRHDIVKGYEYEKGRFVLFTADELKALQAGARDTIDIVSFIPAHAVDPLYYDKAYLLAPARRGEKTYSLLLAALRESGRSALAKWAWRSKQYVVEVRATEGGLVLQQLLYADEVRTPAVLGIDVVDVSDAELKLALKLIDQSAEDAYDPGAFVDEEKLRLMAAIEKKIAGQRIAAPAKLPSGGQVIDLMEALRASLRSVDSDKATRRSRRGEAASAPRKAARTGARGATAPAAKARK